MTASRFVEVCQNCFGERLHSDLREPMVVYLARYSEKYLDELIAVVLRRHPRQFPRCPGITELEGYAEEALARMDAKRQDLTRKALVAPEENEEMVANGIRNIIEELVAKNRKELLAKTRKP